MGEEMGAETEKSEGAGDRSRRCGVPIERNTQKSKGGREREFVIERDALLDEQEGGLIYMLCMQIKVFRPEKLGEKL